VTLWAEVDAAGTLVASSGVTNVTGNATVRFFTFNRDTSKTAFGEEAKVAAGGVDLVVSC
jgi:hypothetical protein